MKLLPEVSIPKGAVIRALVKRQLGLDGDDGLGLRVLLPRVGLRRVVVVRDAGGRQWDQKHPQQQRQM